MKKLTTTLGLMVLACGLAMGQPAAKKHEKTIRATVATAGTLQLQQEKLRSESVRSLLADRLMTRGATLFGKQFESVVSESTGTLVEFSAARPSKAEAVAPPFICRFDYANELNLKWQQYDEDEDSRLWLYKTVATWNYPTADGNEESGYLASRYNMSKAPENWLVTDVPVQLSKGKAYVAFHQGTMSGDYKERLRVYHSKTSGPSGEGLTKIAEIEDDSLGWKYRVVSFEVPETGAYYFSFVHCSDANQYYMLLDNIEIGEGDFVGTPDLLVSKTILPRSACGLGSEEMIGTYIRNTGSAAITKLNLTYSVDGTPKGELVLNVNFAGGSDTTVYFPQKADFSEEGREYKVTVAGQVLASDGKAETVTGNNTHEAVVRHFTPLDRLPFVADLSTADGLVMLGYDVMNWDYFESDGLLNAVEMEPMVTRCMSLENGRKYRFNWRYMAGIELSMLDETMRISESFDVVYGKVGTPVEEWRVLKSYNDRYTNETFAYDEIAFEVPEAGVYSFGVVPRESAEYEFYAGTLCVAYIEVELIAEHNVKLGTLQPSLGRQTPAKHAVAPRLDVAVMNRGLRRENEVKVTVKQGEAAIGVSSEQTIESNDTVAFSVNCKMEKPAVGAKVTLSLEATMSQMDECPNDNKRDWTFTATDGLYAFDDETIELYEDGIGTTEFVFGNLFTLAEPDTLSAVVLGLFDMSPYYVEEYQAGIGVYPVDENGRGGGCLLSHTFTRQLDGGIQVVEVPARILPAGRYLIALRQFSKDEEVAVGYDGNPEGVVYAMDEADGVVEALDGFGYVALRAKFGQVTKLVSKDVELLEVVKPARRGVFGENQAIEVSYRSNGMNLTEAVFVCTVDGVSLEPQKVSVAAYQAGTVSFKADLSARGLHVIKVEAVVDGDENPADNTIEATVETLVMDPYRMDFEICEDFAITGLAPWSVVDYDKSGVCEISGYMYPNIAKKMAFMAFNPFMTTPPIDDYLEPYQGERYGIAFASASRRNNDWLISPKLRMPETNAGMTFYVRVMPAGLVGQVYKERYNVLVSTTTADSSAFVQLGATRETSDSVWTEVNVDLSAYNGQNVYVAIQCVSNDQYIFMIDDIRVNKPLANEKKADLSSYVKSYPNPVSGLWTVTAYGLEINRVEICGMQGGVVYRSANGLATDSYRLDMSGFVPGLYLARVYTNAGVQVLKVLVR